MLKKVNILGQPYVLGLSNDELDETLAKVKGLQGYCDETTKTIVVRCAKDRIKKTIEDGYEPVGLMGVMVEQTAMHEVIHAFMYESGLTDNLPWVHNEDLIDWLVHMIPKMNIAFKDAIDIVHEMELIEQSKEGN